MRHVPTNYTRRTKCSTCEAVQQSQLGFGDGDGGNGDCVAWCGALKNLHRNEKYFSSSLQYFKANYLLILINWVIYSQVNLTQACTAFLFDGNESESALRMQYVYSVDSSSRTQKMRCVDVAHRVGPRSALKNERKCFQCTYLHPTSYSSTHRQSRNEMNMKNIAK